jgi:hypothetical protein
MKGFPPMYSYEEACEVIVTRAMVVREIRRHCLDPLDFFLEVGYQEEYEGWYVLHWLGY